MNCTAAPRYEEQFPETTSEYAEEGRLAHEVCELKLLKKFTTAINQRTYASRLNKLKKDPLYAEEMDRTSDFYIEHLTEKAMGYENPPLVNAEVRVDFAEYVPDGFGTCDCAMIGGDTLDITDYKHSKGIPVSAVGNPQMRLYALGALAKYVPFYGGMIQKIRTTIVQPRVQDEPSSETLSVEELRVWGESIKPLAQKAYGGFGEFVPGEHCRFCRGKAQCRARADKHSALEDFKDCVLPTEENITNAAAIATPTILTHAEIGDLLIRGLTLAAWYKDLENFALKEMLAGIDIPGWKVVEGRSNRAFTDHDAAIAAVIEAGYAEALVYERKPKTLTALEELVGKKEFGEKFGKFIYKPPGKPTPVQISDKREPYNSAAADFADAAKGTTPPGGGIRSEGGGALEIPSSVLIKYDRCRLTLNLPIFFDELALDKVRMVFKMLDERLWQNDDAIETLDQFFHAREQELKNRFDRAKAELTAAKKDAEDKRRVMAALGSTLDEGITQAENWLAHARKRAKKRPEEVKEYKDALERAMRPKTEHAHAVKEVKRLEREVKAAQAALERGSKVINAFKEIKA